ncbi:alternate signal-mediated exported protein [Leucobacter luti]|uniref:hypothetical protein n=1 Tax=Leucobacter luti TaxID=340320 RepID=UPI001051E07A|nr:hypothetical protein [Leucobacter luti]MCW2289144.1 alternate signal-mediated exported protein [Leucobacter luti]TCK35459.1 alternate signal-mediated exported protein [Leucobacter luti]
MRYRTKLIVGASLAAAGVVATASMAVALWNANDRFSGGAVAAGDLNVRTSEGTWEQITPGVASPERGTLSGGTAGFTTMPGDVIEISVPITTTLQGENLNAELAVDTGAGAARDIAAGVVAATYRIEDSAGAQVAPATGEAPLGTPVRVPGLESSNAGSAAYWTVVVTVEVLGDYRWTSNAPTLDLESWSVDGIDVELQQVREGEGFVTAGGGSE